MPPGADTVRMVTPEGDAVAVPADRVAYLKGRGYDFETGVDLGQRLPREAAEAAKADRGALGDVAAFTAGAARGATFGLSDVVAPDLGIERETLRDLQQQHGSASTLGEVGGAVGAALLSGGSSTAATAARFTPAGATALLGTRIAAKGGIVRYAASGAVEGAIQSVGSYVSDVALENKELSAEGFVAAAGTGGLYGGAIGGGIGTAEKAFVKARQLFPKGKATAGDVIRAADDMDAAVQQALSAGDASKVAARDQLELLRLQNLELDTAAKARVLEKRAADAAAAQSRADLAAVRLERAKTPTTNRRGKVPAPDAPVGAVPASPVSAADPGSSVSVTLGDGVAPQAAKEQTWREFVGERMGAAMKSEGGHGPAMKKLGADWKAFKAGKTGTADAAVTMPDGFDWRAEVDGRALFPEQPKVVSGLPDHATAKTTGHDTVYVVRPSDLLARDVSGIQMPGKRAERITSVRSAWDSGTGLAPIEMQIDRNGRLYVQDGNHRLQAAAEMGDRHVAIRLRATAEPLDIVDDIKTDLGRALNKGPGTTSAPLSGRVSPATGGDLEALLGQSVARAKAGESVADLAREARPPSILDEIHEAMAEIDPQAAKLVNAVKAQEAAAVNLERRFKVRAPQQVGGSELKVIPDAPNLTLGRVKQMYEKATEAERTALLQQVGPEKAKALLEIVEGKAGFAKWYKNKSHWWDDPTYGPVPSRVGPTADDLDIVPSFPPGEHLDAIGHAREDALHVVDMDRAASEISEYERSVHDLATALGPAAPSHAAEIAARYGAAVDDQARKQAQRMAQAADDAPVPSPLLAEGSGPVARPPGVTPLADDLAAQQAQAAGARQAADLVSLPGAGGLAKPAKRGGILGMAADLGAANEAMQAVGIDLPFLPDVDKIPLIGPLLGMYFKVRAGATVLSKAGFRVPLTGEAKVAVGATKTRDRVAQSVDRLLAGGAKVTGKARPYVAAQGWRVDDVLSRNLDGETPRRKFQGTPAEMLRARVDELREHEANPAAVRSSVRAALRDVRDPDVVRAVQDVATRRLDYLAKHAPLIPAANPLSGSKWAPSPALVERFARRVRAANDPASVLDDVGTGRVTPEAAETLREVYPQLYAEAQARLLEQSTKMQRRLPHATVVRLSVLFNVPLTSSLEPENLAAIQASGAPKPAPQGPAPAGPAMSPPPAGAPDLSSIYMTPAQRRMR